MLKSFEAIHGTILLRGNIDETAKSVVKGFHSGGGDDGADVPL